MEQRLIDANTLYAKVDGEYLWEMQYEIERAETILNIPENPTNGDMIKTMFSYGQYGTNKDEVHVFGVGGNGILVFSLDWWNAPYKKESEDLNGYYSCT